MDSLRERGLGGFFFFRQPVIMCGDSLVKREAFCFNQFARSGAFF